MYFQFPAGLTFLEKFGAGVQQCSCDHHDRGGAVTGLDILGFGQLHQLKDKCSNLPTASITDYLRGR